MIEMVGKRQRDIDSLTMWESDEPPSKRVRGDDRGDRRRHYQRDDSHRRSCSRDVPKIARERSRSRGAYKRENKDRKVARDRGNLDEYRRTKRDGSRGKDSYRQRKDSPQRRYRSRSPAREPMRQQATGDNGPVTSSQMNLTPSMKDPLTIKNTPRPQTDRLPRQDSDSASVERTMGFSGFGSTKNTKVPGNNVGAVRKDKQIKARQYMNRVGGFNRPLSPTR